MCEQETGIVNHWRSMLDREPTTPDVIQINFKEAIDGYERTQSQLATALARVAELEDENKALWKIGVNEQMRVAELEDEIEGIHESAAGEDI